MKEYKAVLSRNGIGEVFVAVMDRTKGSDEFWSPVYGSSGSFSTPQSAEEFAQKELKKLRGKEVVETWEIS